MPKFCWGFDLDQNTVPAAVGTSRILEGLNARRGLVERREGIGCSLRQRGELEAVGPAAGGVVDASDLDFWGWIDAETLFFGLARARAVNGGIGRVAALKYPIGSRSGSRP